MTEKNFTSIDCKGKDLHEELLPRLKGRVFHITSDEGYANIKKVGEIRHNKNREFQFSFSQSELSYGRKRGYICLIDLRNATPDEIEEALGKYYFLNPRPTSNNPFFLFLTENLYPALIPWTKAKEEKALGEMWVPYVECWHNGDIPIEKITDVIEVRVKHKPHPLDSLVERLNSANAFGTNTAPLL